MGSIALYTRAKKLGGSLVPFWRKDQKVKTNTYFGNLISYNPRLNLFSKKTSGSNDGPYWPLYSCKKFERSLKPLEKRPKKSKTPFLDKKHLFWIRNLIPYNLIIRFFFKETILLKRWILFSFTAMPKIGKILRAVLEKRQKTSYGLTEWRTGVNW